LEAAHSERLFRTAACVAVRDGAIGPGDAVRARLAPGRVRERHGTVLCLESCAVELLDAGGGVAARVEFPRVAFAAFAAARAVHLLVESGAPLDTLSIAYSLHAAAGDEEPFAVERPALPPLSVAALARAAVPHGSPADDWVATFVTPEARAGLDAIERRSRATRVEAAGRIRTRVGFDAERRCFVRVLDEVVISRATEATAVTVVSTAASWAEFLGPGAPAGPQAHSSLHTHLHLPEAPGGDGAAGDHLLAAGAETLPADGEPCISINDIVTHYTAFPDPLSAALIVSLFPDRRVVTLYGYTPRAQLRREPGWWALS
jgi:hypothetical protein